MLASAVSAPIFFAVANTRLPNFSFSSDWMPAAMSVMYFKSSRSVRAFITPCSSITSLRAVLTSVAPLGIDISRS